MPSTRSKDPIFRSKRKSPWKLRFLFLFVLILLPLLYLKYRPLDIPQQHQSALKHVSTILRALEVWKKNDYDANSRFDYPLCRLRSLYETQLINGKKIALIPKSLSLADLREKKPIAYQGYYFTLTSSSLPWPKEGTGSQIAVLATPEKIGITGTCSFYINTSGEAYYTSFKLEEKAPKWPSYQLLQLGIWKALPDDLKQNLILLNGRDSL